MMVRFLALIFVLFASLAGARQDAAPVKSAIEEYLRLQTQGLPGKVTYSVGEIDAGNNLVPCSSLDVALPKEGRLWGRGNVIVRCQAEPGWKLYVPIHVRVTSEFLVTSRALGLGQTITETDLDQRSGDLTELPDGIFNDKSQAVGRITAQAIPAGRPLRSDMLRLPLVVQQGQGVKVVSRGSGFQVSSEGRALKNAAAGQVVQVRLSNGQVVSGIARSGGVVEVVF